MDSNLRKRGCILVFTYGLCLGSFEDIDHLILKCLCVFFYLWNWISSTLQTPLNLHSLENLLYILKQHVSPQLRSIRLVAIIFVIWGIWHCRDKQRFNNVVIPLHNIKIMISSFISLVGNSDLGTMGRSIDELCVFKAFNIARNLTQALLHHSSAS